ncbi:MAG: hypothetical protein GQ540_03650 [Lutibacter sp.]|uniref:hypothetical protein n=1 Tax=Lutibacter sp. TaxID=1925666 RepID=UPI0019E0F1F4|nr:hypothetical protein [Lutibacter sp.]NOR27607.1 hypothetical protein [Lutibacter sp.]
MAAKSGRLCSIKLGTNLIQLMGTWSMPGVSTDLLESTAFGDDWKQFKTGLLDGGTITFNGLYDPADTTGQDALRTANEDSTELTDVRLYIDSTSYWIPTTTGPASYMLVTDWEIGADKSALMTASFSLKVSGKLELI